MNRLLVKAALLCMASGPALMKGAVVFSNVTGTGSVTSGSFVCNAGTGVSPCPTGVGQSLFDAEQFTPTADYMMTGAQMLVSSNEPVKTFDVFLYSNGAGQPGASIEQIGFDLSANSVYPGSLVTANTIGTPITLLAGTPYWLVLAPHDTGSFVNWENGGSPTVPFASSLNSGANWNVARYNDQFQIDGDPIQTNAVPEPSGYLLLFGGIVGLIGLRRRL